MIILSKTNQTFVVFTIICNGYHTFVLIKVIYFKFLQWTLTKKGEKLKQTVLESLSKPLYYLSKFSHPKCCSVPLVDQSWTCYGLVILRFAFFFQLSLANLWVFIIYFIVSLLISSLNVFLTMSWRCHDVIWRCHKEEDTPRSKLSPTETMAKTTKRRPKCETGMSL